MFNVLVAGAQVSPSQMTYGYTHWMQELSTLGLSGNALDGICSGLISQTQHEMAPVYTLDLSRCLPSERLIPRSVVLQCTNASLMTIDILCILEFDQVGFRVDVLSGARV